MKSIDKRLLLVPVISLFAYIVNLGSCCVREEFLYHDGGPGLGMLIGWTLRIIIHLIANFPFSYAICYISRRYSFNVAAASTLPVIIGNTLLFSFDYSFKMLYGFWLPFVLLIWVPFLMILAKEVRDKDRVLGIVAVAVSVALLAYMAWLIPAGCRLQFEDRASGRYEAHVSLVLSVCSWMAYYMMPRWHLLAVLLAVMILAYCVVPALSWQMFMMPLFAAITFFAWHGRRTKSTQDNV